MTRAVLREINKAIWPSEYSFGIKKKNIASPKHWVLDLKSPLYLKKKKTPVVSQKNNYLISISTNTTNECILTAAIFEFAFSDCFTLLSETRSHHLLQVGLKLTSPYFSLPGSLDYKIRFLGESIEHVEILTKWSLILRKPQI